MTFQNFNQTKLHFEYIRPLNNEGKNSFVFIGRDIQLDTELIIKRIPKTQFRDPQSWFNEAKIMYNNQHPHIVPIQYSCQDDSNIYISMPHFTNGSLHSLLNNRYLKVSEIIRYSIEFLAGLKFIHSNRLVHFDVKPSNVLISDNGKAMVADFGLAKHLNQLNSTAIPEQQYVMHNAPEYFQSQELTHHSDIYQAGLTIYRMSNGNQHFYEQFDKYYKDGDFNDVKYESDVLKGKFPDRGYYLPHIPQKLRNYVRRALSPEISHRYDSALELTNNLASIEVKFDWQFGVKENSAIWTCDTEDRHYEIKHTWNGTGGHSIIVHKSSAGRKPRKITKYCQKNLTLSEAKSLLTSAFRDNNL